MNEDDLRQIANSYIADYDRKTFGYILLIFKDTSYIFYKIHGFNLKEDALVVAKEPGNYGYNYLPIKGSIFKSCSTVLYFRRSRDFIFTKDNVNTIINFH